MVASTEFGSAIRTKSFLIGILLLPVIIGRVDRASSSSSPSEWTPGRGPIAVIDRTGELYPAIERAAQAYNAQAVDAQGKGDPPADSSCRASDREPDDVDAAAVLELSDRIRRGELDAFVVIPRRDDRSAATERRAAPRGLEYHSDNPNDDVVRNWLAATVNDEVRSRRFRSAGIDQAVADRLSQPVAIDNLGLVERERSAAGGQPAIKAAQKVDPVRTAVVPAVLMFVMFFVVMTSTPQLSTA